MSASGSFGRGFRDGCINAIPFAFVMTPFGMLFGVIGTEAGLDIDQVLGFSIFVLAGASQITAVSLMSEHAPTLVILATSLAVNLRMGMYSAALVPTFGSLPMWKRALGCYWLFDQPFALTSIDLVRKPQRSVDERVAFYLGVAIPLSLLWYLGTYLGAVVGESIPADIGFDFAVPATFLALVAPMLRSIAHLAAALTSIIGTLLFYDLPFNTGFLAAAGIALIVGTEVERRLVNPRKEAVSND